MTSKFTFYYPAEQPLFVTVDVASNAFVIDLLKAIQGELKLDGREVSRNDLRLFKADIPREPLEDLKSRALQWLHQQPENGHLQREKTLVSLFPDGPRLAHDLLDIIVADAEVLEMVKGLGDPGYVSYLVGRMDYLRRRRSRGTMHTFLDLPIHLGRPGGAPAAIYNPALAILQQNNLEHLEQVEVSCPDIERAAKYLQCGVAFYQNDALRQMVIKELIDEAIGEKGDWWYDTFLILVLELKNTLGLSGDPLLQAVIDYSKVVSREKYKRFRGHCNFPIVLLGATANHLEISVAICVELIYVSRLLVLDLSFRCHASDNVIRVARAFKALSLCQWSIAKTCLSAVSIPSWSTTHLRSSCHLWTLGTQPLPCTLPSSVTPARRLLSNLLHVTMKRHKSCNCLDAG
ncbi:hypothetical protein BDZ97DRAFT_2059090 [Flammula alnicola]|nr:hypothetical protein BDZ97DRAFT_2059090 [Flammula alnicola]